jgi:signal transduction histidine kinase/CheY-like chemotaxis protein/ligand-binding sensor domain-containing protein
VKKVLVTSINLKSFLIALSGFLLFSIITTTHLLAQQIRVTNYKVEDGLPIDLVKSTIEDDQGFIWIATDHGLVRFDGLKFHVYQRELPTLYIKSFLKRKNGQLLVATDMGVVEIISKPDTIAFKEFLKGEKDPTDSTVRYPKVLYEDSFNTLWITENRGIVRYRDGQLKRYIFPAKDESFDFIRSFSIFEDELGNLYTVTIQGNLYKYDTLLDRFIEIELPQKIQSCYDAILVSPGKIWIGSSSDIWEITINKNQEVTQQTKIASNLDVSCLSKDRLKQFVYCGTWSKGLYRADLNKKDIAFEKIEELHHNKILHFYTDNEGNQWVASDAGLNHILYTFFAPYSETLLNSYVHDIKEAPDGSLLVCHGSDLVKISQNNKNPKVETIFTPETGQAIQVEVQRKGIWIGTNQQILYLLDHEFKHVKSINITDNGWAPFYLYSDKEQNLWVLQKDGKSVLKINNQFQISQYGPEKGLVSDIQVIKQNMDGKIFCAGSGDNTYLFEYQPENEKFINLSVKLDFNYGRNFYVKDMEFDNDGNIWLASSIGLLKYKDGKVERADLGRFTEEVIKSVSIGKDGGIWLGTLQGLIKYKNHTSVLFNESSGLPNKTISDKCLYISKTEKIWAGTSTGIGVSQGTYKLQFTPTPIFYNAKADNQSLSIKPDQKVSYLHGATFKISFISLSYPGKNILYQTRLLGSKDESWSEPLPQTEINLANLPSGDYTLQVRSLQQGGYEWSNPASFHFTVFPAWYETWWAYAIYFILLISLILLAVKFYTWKLVRDRDALKKVVEERTQEIIQKNNELEEYNQHLILAKQKAEDASLAKEQFLSTMSHEIRTPLNAVIGMTYLMMQANPREDQVKDLKTLEISAKNLLALINDILDFSKIEAGKIELEKVEFNIEDLVKELIETFQYSAKEKGLTLNFNSNLKDNTPKNLLGDPVRITQIITNLLSNAVKFTAEGHIKVDLNITNLDKEEVLMELKVSDTGIGIAANKLETIFENFTQATNDTTRKFGGTGLGLAIIKKLIELLNGEITVDSKLDEGSIFTVKLKLQKALKQGMNEEEKIKQRESNRLENKKILLVEDNVVNQIIATRILEKWKLKIEVANNGKEAVDMVAQNTYDLILMDIQMPEMDGYQATDEIRKMKLNNPVPIIALTAATFLSDAEKVKMDAMDGYLTKPLNIAEMYDKISACLLDKDDLKV